MPSSQGAISARPLGADDIIDDPADPRPPPLSVAVQFRLQGTLRNVVGEFGCNISVLRELPFAACIFRSPDRELRRGHHHQWN